MINQELASIFLEMSNYLRMRENSFRSVAYRKVASVLESMEEDVEEVYKKGGLKALEEIETVGENIAKRIEEYIKTGKVKAYEDLKKKTPIKLNEITAVEGLGVRKAKVLYEKLKIKNLKDLEKAAKAGKIAKLPSFKEKTEQNILQGIEFLKKDQGRLLLGNVLLEVEEIIKKISSLKEVEKINVAGSVRRKKETVKDVDILVASSKPKKIMDFFTSMKEVEKVWGKGLTKSSVRVKEGFDIDLRIVKKNSFGAALQYFTGSREHNIKTRKIAISKGLKLNEYGVFKREKKIAGKTEEEVYKAIGLPFIPPEIREDRGEIEDKLPKLIERKDIKGDLHCHSSWNGGEHSISQMAQAAKKLGYEYIGISDHTQFLKIEKGLNEKQLLKQKKEIEKLNGQFRILQGCEVNIMKDGSLDIKDSVLEQMDYVIAGVHSLMKMSKKEMTKRIITAMKNPHVDILAHPTGRVLKRREAYQMDFEKILEAAKKYKVILEINSSPDRLDLNDLDIKKAKEKKVKMIINTDAHHRNQLSLMEMGVAQARRGWAEKEDIINTKSAKDLIKYFK